MFRGWLKLGKVNRSCEDKYEVWVRGEKDFEMVLV
jgi:hypothetical protein